MSVSSFTFFKPSNNLMLSNEQKKSLYNALEEFKTNLNQLENAIHTEAQTPSVLKH